MAKRKGKGSAATEGPRMSVDESLDALAGAWSGTDAQERVGFPSLPEGRYQAVVDKAELGHAKTGTHRLQVIWTLRILEGPYANQTILKIDGLENEDNISWFKATMQTLELETDASIKELPRILEEAKGLILNIQIRERAGYTNIYINELVEAGGGAAEEKAPEEEEERADCFGNPDEYDPKDKDCKKCVDNEECAEAVEEAEEEAAPKKKRKRGK